MRRAVCAVVVLALAGCGGSSRPKSRAVTLPGYGGFAAQTITGAYSAPECAKDVRSFAREGLLLVAHVGAAAAYPADLYYMDLRIPFADFVARGCDPADLGRALERRMTPRQRQTLAGNLPSAMAQLVRDGLRHAN
ncbi:MAG: hypothetical protein ACRDL2_14290 [Gaiellaceae bacterium]